MLERILLLVVGIVVSLMLAGDTFAAKSLMPAEKSSEQEQSAPKKSGEASKAVKAEQSYNVNQVYGEIRSGLVSMPKEHGKTDYCVSPAVKRDRRLPIDFSNLKYYALGKDADGVWITEKEEANWITERNGAMMLVDPNVSQNLSRPLPER